MHGTVSARTFAGTLAGIFLLVLVCTVAVVTISEDKAQTNYQNQLKGCYRGNPLRKAVFAETESSALRAEIVAAPHIRPDGSTICKDAILKP